MAISFESNSSLVSLYEQSSKFFVQMNKGYSGTYPTEIEEGRTAVTLIIEKILMGEFDKFQTAPQLEEFKKKLLTHLPSSERFTLSQKIGMCKKMQLIGSEHISACQCSEEMSCKKRLDFNQTVLMVVETFFTNKTSLRICSIGSGNCFQELMIHAAFAAKNYQISWLLLEPELKDETSSAFKATMQFRKMISFLSGTVAVDCKAIGCHQYLADMVDSEKSAWPDLFLAVDVESVGSGDSVNFGPLRKKLAVVEDKNNPRMLIELDKKNGIRFS